MREGNEPAGPSISRITPPAPPGSIADPAATAALAEALLFQEGRVLLIRRKDVPVWSLPGGHRDPGETADVSCVREVLEETGLRVAVAALAGAYERPWWLGGGRAVLYRCRLVGGALRAGEYEAEATFYPVDRLPRPLLYWYQAIIAAAAADPAAPLHPAAPTLPGFLASLLAAPRLWWPLARHALLLYVTTRLAQRRARRWRAG
jgi:ADP-ribose pyrophosphatase YjhB (NUDIX family)